MRNRLWPLLIAIAVRGLTSTAPADDDWQYWDQLVFKHEFNDRLALDIASVQKWHDGMSDFFLYNISIVPTVSLTKNLSLGAGYLCERKEKDGQWLTENRFLVPLAIGWSAKPWLFQLRNQLEYRDMEKDRNRWRIRERIVLKWPVQIGRLSVIPFVSEEAFYDFTVGQMNQNRAAVGLSVPWPKHVTLTIFYMTKSEHNDDWSTANVLGTEAAVKF